MSQHDVELKQRLTSAGMYSPLGHAHHSQDPLSPPDPSHANHSRFSQYSQVPQMNDDDNYAGTRPLLHQQGSSRSSYPFPSTEYTPSPGQYDAHKSEANNLHAMGVPKKVLETTWKRFFKSWPVHLFPVTATVAVTYVGSTRWFWYPEQGPVVLRQQLTHDITSNLLQLLAKVHEIIIVFSMSAIALAMFRRRLVGDGVRLGFLTGGYRVGDLEYLFSSPFRHQGMDYARPWEVLLCGFLVFATIMSTLVGPVSAVLLVPAIGWFDYAPGTAFSNIASPLIYGMPQKSVWPPSMEVTNNTQSCVRSSGIYSDGCPARGFREIYEWVKDWSATDLRNPLIYQSTTSSIARHLVTIQASPEKSVILSTTPSDFLVGSIGLFKNYIANTPVGEVSGDARYRLATKSETTVQGDKFASVLYQPMVQSKCKVYDYGEYMKLDKVSYPSKDFNCMGDTDCKARKDNPASLVPKKSRFKDGQVMDDVTDFGTAERNSTFVYIAGQITEPVIGEPIGKPNGELNSKIYLCNMIASWMPANFSIDPTVGNVLQSSISDNMQDAFANADQATAANQRGRVVKFNNSWLNLLNPMINQTADYRWSSLDALTEYFGAAKEPGTNKTYKDLPPSRSSNETALEIFLAKVFGVYLTEGLARTSTGYMSLVKLPGENATAVSFTYLNYQHRPTWRVNNITAVDATHVHDAARNETIKQSIDYYKHERLGNYLPIVLEAQRYGYGTGQQRKTLHFAQAIMAIYLATVALYALAITVGHIVELLHLRGSKGARLRVLSVAAWDDLQGLLILALKTPAPGGDLADAGAGVTSTGTWKKIVRARADELDRVQLVLDEDDGGQKTHRLDETGKERYY
ncbi:cytochrome p450 61 [Apiospora arundinis]